MQVQLHYTLVRCEIRTITELNYSPIKKEDKMSFKFSELPQKLSIYLLDAPDLVTEEYEVELATLIGVFRKVTTPVLLKKGNLLELQDPFPEHPDPYRTRLSQLVLDRLERTIDVKTYLQRTKEVEDEFEQRDSSA